MAVISGRMVVLYKGQVVEEGLTDDVIQNPLHPYTRVLVAATPDLDKPAVFEGILESEESPAVGCRFAPRCPYRQKSCLSNVELRNYDGRLVRCILW